MARDMMLLELQAALRGGAAPSEAVAATCATGPLEDVARAVRLGRPLADAVADVPVDDPAADLLIRCLALTERLGDGGVEAVDHALAGIRAETSLRRLLDVRTAQARGTALVLATVPVAAWLLLVALDPRMLRFYASPLGWATAAVAIAMAFTSWRWMRRLTAGVARHAAAADPLTAPPAPPNWRRGMVCGLPAGAVAAAVLGPVAGALTAAVTCLVIARAGRSPAATPGATAETVALVAVALEAGLPVTAAFAEVAAVAPASAAAPLATAARRLASGWQIESALADSPLAPLGTAVAAAHRWGAPAVPALQALAEEIRDQRRAAVELAAERLQLALIFPTTLLTLPAFVLGVVPPLLAVTLRG